MTSAETIGEIIEGYETETSSLGGIFSFVKGKAIALKAKVTEERFSTLFEKACRILGAPAYVHSYYGYLWAANGKVLGYNLYEKNYNDEAMVFFILNRMPYGKKWEYREYVQTDETVKEVFAEHDVCARGFIHYTAGEFMILGDRADAEYAITLKPRSLEFYCSSKESCGELTKIVPRCFRKEAVSCKDLSGLKSALRRCFEEKSAK